MRLRRIARDHDIRRHVARDDRAAADEGVGADLRKLMHGAQAAERHPISHLDMASQGGAVRKHCIAAHDAIVCDVRIRHEQIVAPDGGHALVVSRPPVDGAVLAEHIPVADLQPRRLALILLVLGRIPEGGKRKDAVPGTDAGRAVDDNVWTHHRPRADLDVGPDDREGSHGHILGKPGLRGDERQRVDHLPVSGATIISACATSLSPTKAAVAKRQIPLKLRSSWAVSTS